MEASTAKAALVQAARAAARNMLRVADPRAWTEDYPWKSTGVAAVAGFFVAARRPPAPSEASPPERPEGQASKAASPWDIVTSLLLSTGTEAVKSVLTPWLAEKIQGALQAHAAAASPSTPENPENAPAGPHSGEQG